MSNLDESVIYEKDSLRGFNFYSNISIISGVKVAATKLKAGESGEYYFPSTNGGYYLSSTLPIGVIRTAPVKVKVSTYEFLNEDQQIGRFLKSYNPGVPITTSSKGLRLARITQNLGGKAITSTSETLNVKYVGKLLDGTRFDSSDSTQFTISGLIPGFQDALLQMRVGEKAIAIFPSALGYGANGTSKIPGYSPLLFEITVLSKQ